MPSDFATSALDRARVIRREARFLAALRALPLKVAAFQWRARRLAVRSGDEFSWQSATRPAKLATLLSVAENRRSVVELGTATGWASISLLLADPMRVLVSYDLVRRPELDQYLQLVSPSVRRRLQFVCAPGDQGPHGVRGVELLYIDSSHARAATVREVQAWKPVLADGAVIVFDDYTHGGYPGIREAVEDLGLEGHERDGLFVHHVSAAVGSAPRPDWGGHLTQAL
jgi:Methyltransferase domain